MRWRCLVLPGLLVLAGGVLLACDLGAAAVATPTPTAGAVQHFRVGQQVSIGHLWQITVNGTKTSTGDPFSRPPAGHTYLVIDLTMKNVATGQQTANPFDYGLRDPQGNSEPIALFTSLAPFGGTLTPGEQSHGQIAFTVPKTTHQVTLAYAPSTTYPIVVLAEWNLSI